MVSFATKMHAPIIKKWHIIYRSYKHFSEQTYIQDLSYIPFQVCEIFDHVNDAYRFACELKNLQKGTIRNNQIPYLLI